jgi:hypothetical protein
MSFIQLTEEECTSRLVRYTKRTKAGGLGQPYSVVKSVTGVPGKEGYIHEALGCGRVKSVATKIPNGYKKNRLSKKFMRTWYCKVPNAEEVAKAKKGGVELYEWIKKMRSRYITIATVSRMKKGQTIKMLSLNRNIGDETDGFPEYELYTPAHFFRFSAVTYTHDHGVTGTIKFHWQGKDEDPYPFTFEIEYKPESWFPLDKDDNLPSSGDQGFSPLLGKKIHYTKFPRKTPLGYRGPMIPWSTLSTLPKVYLSMGCD